MNQYSLTLDSILGSVIHTDVSLNQQPPLIKVLMAFVIAMFTLGLASNVCSIFTFYHVDILKFGCGYYLLILSMLSILTLILFVSRFMYLIISQITIIENKLTCMSFDFVLYLFVAICDWITACIACERMISTIKGVHFQAKQSVRAVKFILPLLITVLTLTSIHQVIHFNFSH
jgi:hypothetical protein